MARRRMEAILRVLPNGQTVWCQMVKQGAAKRSNRVLPNGQTVRRQLVKRSKCGREKNAAAAAGGGGSVRLSHRPSRVSAANWSSRAPQTGQT